MHLESIRRENAICLSVPHKKISCLQRICNKIKTIWEAFWGFLARVFVFHAAVAHTFCSRLALGVLRGRLCSKTMKEGGVDEKKMGQLLHHLKALGGKEDIAKAKDGKTEVQYVVLKFSELKKKVEDAGGELIAGDENVIKPPSKENPKWKELVSSLRAFCYSHPKKMGWKENADGSFILGKNAQAKEGTCLLRCRGPGGALESKSVISSYLGAGIDLCLFNWPGTLKSRGTPSEGCFYAAAEAVYQELIQMGFIPDRMYASGFCLGGGVAANLYKDHFREGLHLMLENTFPSMLQTMKRLSMSDHLSDIGIRAIQSPDYNNQDGLDTVSKLHRIPETRAPSICVLSTKNDISMPTDSFSSLVSAASTCTKKVHQICWQNPYKKGHSVHGDEPLQYKEVWDRHLEWFKD